MTQNDIIDRHGNSVVPSEPKTKLQEAVEKVTASLSIITTLGATVRELSAAYPRDHKFDVSTKDAKKATDAVRKRARETRLDIKKKASDAKNVLNGFKTELVALADADAAEMQRIEDTAKDAVEADDLKEEARKQKHRDSIAAIKLLSEGASLLSSEDLAKRIVSMESVIVDESYEEFQPEATQARADVVSVLTEAKAQALQREDAARLKAERQAKIDAWKELPAQCEGTEAASIHVMLDAHNKAAPTASEFGDMLEVAELWHFKIAKELEELWTQTGLAEERLRTPPETSDSHPDNHGPLSNLPHDEAEEELTTEDEDTDPEASLYQRAVALVRERNEASIAAIQRLGVTWVKADELIKRMCDEGVVSPVNEQLRRTVLPCGDVAKAVLPPAVAAAVAPTPAPGAGWRVVVDDDDPFSAPAATPAPPRRAAPRGTPTAGQLQHGTADGLPQDAARIYPDEPREPLTALSVLADKLSADTAPDLLTAATRVLAAWKPVVEGQPQVPELDAAMRELQAAVDFINEFAD